MTARKLFAAACRPWHGTLLAAVQESIADMNGFNRTRDTILDEYILAEGALDEVIEIVVQQKEELKKAMNLAMETINVDNN